MNHETSKPSDKDVPPKTPERLSIAGIATASARISFASARVQAATELLIPRLGQLNPDALDDLVIPILHQSELMI
jgi:hypothetical protein